MDRKTKYALAAAIGAVSLMTLNAFAQQDSKQPAQPPAAAAPAAPASNDTAATKDGGTAQSGDKKEAATANKDDSRADNRPRWGQRHWRGDRSMGRRGAMRQRWRNMSEADRKAFFEARIAAVRAGLMLNETQARQWPNVETAVREMFAKRQAWAERIRKEGRPANPFDRMKRRGDMMAERGAALQKFATAAKPLYDTLTDDQKRRLRILTRGFGPRSQMMRRGGNRHWHRGHHGMRGQRWQRQGRYHQNWRNNRAGRSDGQGRRWRQRFEENTGFNRGNGLRDWQSL